MSVPDELVQAVRDALDTRSRNTFGNAAVRVMTITEATLDAVPDGWAKIDGEWVRLEQALDGNYEVIRRSLTGDASQ